jgi:hypothetical protein
VPSVKLSAVTPTPKDPALLLITKDPDVEPKSFASASGVKPVIVLVNCQYREVPLGTLVLVTDTDTVPPSFTELLPVTLYVGVGGGGATGAVIYTVLCV